MTGLRWKLFLGTTAIGSAIACPLLFPAHFGGAAAVGVAKSGISALAGFLMGPMAQTVGSLGGNILADGICEVFDGIKAPGGNSQQNQHLALAVGNAFAKVLRNNLHRPECASSVRNVERLIDVAPGAFPALLLQHDIALDEAIDLPALLAAASRGEPVRPALSTDAWEAWLTRISSAYGASLDPDSRKYLAAQLHLNLFEQVRQTLKQDFEHGGKSYAAFHMLCLGRLLDGMGKLLRNSDDILRQANATAEDVAVIKQVILERNRDIHHALTDDERLAVEFTFHEVIEQSKKLDEILIQTRLTRQAVDRGLPLPFYNVARSPKGLFGLFRPTRDEFEAGLIYEPKITSQVVETLKAQRCALVRGGPSSGKSVLAVQIALQPDFKDRAFYLDLDLTDRDATEKEISIAAEALLGAGSLLILDNVHLRGDLAAHIACTCEERDGFVLMLGRPNTGTTGQSGPALKKYENPDLALPVSKEALLSTYRMVLRGEKHPPIKEPPEPFLETWFGWYGNKLSEFARAVKFVAYDLSLPTPRWSKLTQSTAVLAVQTTYRLNESNPARLDALRRLAVLQRYEITADSTVVSPITLDQEIEEGWIETTTRGKQRVFTHLKVWHAQEAELILQAMGNVDVPKQLETIAREHAFTASIITYRLAQAGDTGSARAVLLAYIENDLARVAEYVFCNGFFGAASRVFWLNRFAGVDLHSVDRALAENDAITLREYLEDASLDYIAAFLKSAEANLSRTYKKCMEILATPELWGESSNMRVLATALDGTVTFLQYVEKEQVRQIAPELHKAVLDVLSNAKDEDLAKRVLATPLDGTTLFLQYVEQKHVKQVAPDLHKAILDVLSNAKDEELVECVVATPLGKTTFFLQYVEKKKFPLFRRFLDILRAPDQRRAFTKGILVSSTGDIAAFIKYLDAYVGNAADAAKDVTGFVRSLITSDTHRRHWIDRLLVSPAGQIYSFLKILDEPGAKDRTQAKRLVAAIPIETWKERIPQKSLGEPEALYGLLTLLKQLERGDLANATAIAAVMLPDRSRWRNGTVFSHHATTVCLHHASIALGFAIGADPADIRQFSDDVLTPAWLDRQYQDRKTNPGAIAAAIFGVYLGQGREVAKRFGRPPLHHRLAQSMVNPVTGRQGEPSHAIQLLGCCALIGIRPEGTVKRLAPGRIRALCAPLGNERFGYIQMQFWLGLRELSPAGAAGLPLPAGAMDQAINGFSPTEKDTVHARELKNSMLRWLSS